MYLTSFFMLTGVIKKKGTPPSYFALANILIPKKLENSAAEVRKLEFP